MVTVALGDYVDRFTQTIENAAASGRQKMFEPVIRLGVTGLSRAGKTVFITSLVANLLDRGRMPQLRAAAEGSITAAYLQPHPGDTTARFDYENHLAALTGADPTWPQSTRAISQLRLSFKIQPRGLLAGLKGPRRLHVDIIDYPGEWLLDLPLLKQSYAQWSKQALALADGPARREHAKAWRARLANTDPLATFDEPEAVRLAQSFTAYLHAARNAGFSACAPGRFLLPGDLEGAPALSFAPLPPCHRPGRKSLYKEMERRFTAYKSKIIRPFFRTYFAGIDRQVVLVDALGAIDAGPQALEDLRVAMGDILMAFKPGNNAILTRLLGRRAEKILFAATKVDHLHHSQHPKLTNLLEALLRGAKDRAEFAGADTKALSIAALRATVETQITHQGVKIDCVRGELLGSKGQMAFYPGELPEDPGQLLSQGRTGAQHWHDGTYEIKALAPAPMGLKPGQGPPHIRLDQVAEFLLGDRLI